jgi:hypothetical protein
MLRQLIGEIAACKQKGIKMSRDWYLQRISLLILLVMACGCHSLERVPTNFGYHVVALEAGTSELVLQSVADQLCTLGWSVNEPLRAGVIGLKVSSGQETAVVTLSLSAVPNALAIKHEAYGDRLAEKCGRNLSEIVGSLRER